MARDAASFRRSRAKRNPQPTVLVLCEDSKSSLTYLTEAAQEFRAIATLRIAHPGTTAPLGIVSAAVREIRNYEQIYCVVDRDEHANFDEARMLAAHHAPRISLCVSHPCFEYWLLLHFMRTRKPYTRAGTNSPCDAAHRDLKAVLPTYSKGNVRGLFRTLFPRLEQALANSEWAAADALESASANPSTGFHELIAKFKQLGSP